MDERMLPVFPVFVISRLDLWQIYGFSEEQALSLTDEDMESIATCIRFDTQYTKKFVHQKVYRETQKVLTAKEKAIDQSSSEEQQAKDEEPTR